MGADPEERAVFYGYIDDYGVYCLELEADPRHAEIIPPELGLDRGPNRPVTTPGSKASAAASGAVPTPLADPSEVTAYGGISARGLYLAADRPDLAFSVKGVARSMSKHTVGCWERLKRIGRYPETQPRCVSRYDWQGAQSHLQAFTDADWA